MPDDISPVQNVPPPTVQPTSTATPATQEISLVGPARTPLPLSLPTVAPSPELAWRPPPYPIPWALNPQDHFYFARPIPSGQVNWPHPFYRYGNTHFGDQPVHTGVDLGADRGAPVLAAASGEVIWTGYGLYRGVEDPSDPYGLAVAIRHDFGYQGEELYTVYAHLQSIVVWNGQRVETGEQIGTVGSTGESEGPHLHFEVRLGENSYFNTRNPELWMVPPEGWAVLAGRITDTYGNLMPEYQVQIKSVVSGQQWDVWTYAPGTVHPDQHHNENFVISDLPAGPYEVRVDFIGRSFNAHLLIHPGETNYIIFRGRRGFFVHPTPTPSDLSRPPDL
ncbi:MAG: peptidoglycan DD-metalloendopeptidase family protein [Anaerolineales bacterium]|nr:peptidoglycan DD-metalloendopeptidase family protein [Anaerolineales bacterium]